MSRVSQERCVRLSQHQLQILHSSVHIRIRRKELEIDYCREDFRRLLSSAKSSQTPWSLQRKCLRFLRSQSENLPLCQKIPWHDQDRSHQWDWACLFELELWGKLFIARTWDFKQLPASSSILLLLRTSQLRFSTPNNSNSTSQPVPTNFRQVNPFKRIPEKHPSCYYPKHKFHVITDTRERHATI